MRLSEFTDISNEYLHPEKIQKMASANDAPCILYIVLDIYLAPSTVTIFPIHFR